MASVRQNQDGNKASGSESKQPKKQKKDIMEKGKRKTTHIKQQSKQTRKKTTKEANKGKR